MPSSSPNELEDIFAETGSDALSSAEPESLVPQSVGEEAVLAMPRLRSSRRRWLLIATIVLALILLLAGGLAIWLWLQARPQPVGNPVTVNNGVVNTPVNLNNTNTADSNTNVVTVPSTPINTPSSNVNTTNFVDVDHDGLSDEEELVVNTNPKKKDTDEDGLSDREEVRVYNTDPRNPDTDGDGYSDGTEVTNFYHPNSPDPKKRLFDLPQ